MTDSTIILTVSGLTKAIKFQLEKQFSFVAVQGEVSNFKRQVSNHLYFTLKDSQAQIQCVMFSSDARLLKTLPKAGDQVEIKGEVNVYPPRGNYQIIVRTLKQAGLGQLLLMLEERKKKYLQMGWFDASLKKNIPKNPKTIGVVSSPTGSVISDILQILKRRAHSFHLILNPVKVQGEGAAKEVSRAIKAFNDHKLVDVIIVARGGGSMEDLWAFNEVSVIESIYESEIPVVCAIGHETDTTLADLVADLRAPTPSAAAELVVEETQKKWDFLKTVQERLARTQLQFLSRQKERFSTLLKHPFLESPERLFRVFDQRLDEIKLKLDQAFFDSLHRFQTELHERKLKLQTLNPQMQIQEGLGRLNTLRSKFSLLTLMLLKKQISRLSHIQERMDGAQSSLLQNKKSNFNNVLTHLKAINPKKLLEKGYSILFDEKQKSVIVSTQDISLKQNVKLLLKDGFIKACVHEIESGESCKT